MKSSEQKMIWGTLNSIEPAPGLLKLEIGKRVIYLNSSFHEICKSAVGKTVVISRLFDKVSFGVITGQKEACWCIQAPLCRT